MSKRSIILICGVLVLLLSSTITWLAVGPKIISKLSNLSPPGMTLAKLGLGVYPAIDESKLSDTQRAVVAITKAEHAAQVDYTKYSQGVREAWCADFVSWVMKEAGEPFVNPHSKGWRIPGTLTLREYYESTNRFKAYDSGYVPQVGDTILYDGAGWFGQHVNIVLDVKDDQVTTVGGNEAGKIRVQTRTLGDDGMIGYGVLEERS